ncbi:MAG: undecaprenyldiphospho-muramoylpentapeptide beta-N-acetylglucosaminyltransferase [Spirochaetaceae bacterium]
MQKTVVFTGGGTAGHVFPGLAVADALRERGDYRIAWIGSRVGMERRIVSERGIPFHGIPAGKLRRYVSLRNVTDVLRVAAGTFAALIYLLRLRPAFVFSKGGYVSVPVIAAARVLGIPCATHESDADPGLATRINAVLVDRILVAYDSTREYLRPALRRRVRVTGNPVRRDLDAADADAGRRRLGFTTDRPLVFFVGGSLGSAQINALLGNILEELLRRTQVVHQRGDHPPLRPDGGGYVSVPFIGEEYPHVLAAADLVVCRAGAGTLWELARLGKPAVLIPLPRTSSRGDQVRNARIFAARGGAIVLEEENAGAERLEGEIVRLLDAPEDRVRMALAVQGFDVGAAEDRIADMICDVAEGRGWTS